MIRHLLLLLVCIYTLPGQGCSKLNTEDLEMMSNRTLGAVSEVNFTIVSPRRLTVSPDETTFVVINKSGSSAVYSLGDSIVGIPIELGSAVSDSFAVASNLNDDMPYVRLTIDQYHSISKKLGWKSPYRYDVYVSAVQYLDDATLLLYVRAELPERRQQSESDSYSYGIRQLLGVVTYSISNREVVDVEPFLEFERSGYYPQNQDFLYSAFAEGWMLPVFNYEYGRDLASNDTAWSVAVLQKSDLSHHPVGMVPKIMDYSRGPYWSLRANFALDSSGAMYCAYNLARDIYKMSEKSAKMENIRKTIDTVNVAWLKHYLPPDKSSNATGGAGPGEVAKDPIDSPPDMRPLYWGYSLDCSKRNTLYSVSRPTIPDDEFDMDHDWVVEEVDQNGNLVRCSRLPAMVSLSKEGGDVRVISIGYSSKNDRFAVLATDGYRWYYGYPQFSQIDCATFLTP